MASLVLRTCGVRLGSGGKAESSHGEDREVMARQTLGNADRQHTQGNTGARARAKHGHGWNGSTNHGIAVCSRKGCGCPFCSGSSLEGCGCAGYAVEGFFFFFCRAGAAVSAAGLVLLPFSTSSLVASAVACACRGCQNTTMKRLPFECSKSAH